MLGNNVAIDRGVKDALILRLGAILGIIFRILVETARDPILGGERGAAAPFPLDADQPTVPAARPLNRWRNFRRRIVPSLILDFCEASERSRYSGGRGNLGPEREGYHLDLNQKTSFKAS